MSSSLRGDRLLLVACLIAGCASRARLWAQDFDAEPLKTGVVRVDTTRDKQIPRDHTFADWLVSEYGTGFVISQRPGSADILTARHVIADYRTVEVHFYNDRLQGYAAHVLPDSSSPELDFAILRVEFPAGQNPLQNMEPYRYATASSLRQDGGVFTMNAAYDLVPNSIVNLKIPHEPGRFKYTLGSTGPGFSGGPGFDPQGRLVGMHTSSTAEEGRYAVSVTMAAILEEIGTTPYPVGAMNELLPAGTEGTRPAVKPNANASSGSLPRRVLLGAPSAPIVAPGRTNTVRVESVPLASTEPPAPPKRVLREAKLLKSWEIGTGGRGDAERAFTWNPAGTYLALLEAGVWDTISILSENGAQIQRVKSPINARYGRMEWTRAGLFFGARDTFSLTLDAESHAVALFPNQEPPFAAFDIKLSLNGWSSSLRTDLFAFRTASKINKFGESTITVGRLQDHTLDTTFDEFVYSLAISPNGQRIATGFSDLKVWDGFTTKILWQVEQGVHLADVITHILWSDDGRSLATHLTPDKFVRIYDAETGTLLSQTTPQGKTVESISWSPDGRRIATSSEDTKAIISDAKTGKQLMVIRPQRKPEGSFKGLAVAWNPKGTTVAIATSGTTELYDVGEY